MEANHSINACRPLRSHRPRKPSCRHTVSDIVSLPRHIVYPSSNEDLSAFDINYPWFWQTVPSKQDVQLYSNLPLDIVRSIFDMAMSERPQPSHLLLVSREVKSWIEPLLYRHLYFPDVRGLGLFYRTFSEWRKKGRKADTTTGTHPSLLEAQTLTVGCCGRYGLTRGISAMLCEMTNLYHLDYWSTFMPVIFNPYARNATWPNTETHDTYPFKNLRCLSLDTRFFVWDRSITFKHRVFRDITHMDMYFNENVPWESLRHAESLTHLALDMVHHLCPPYSTQELDSWVTTLIEACPPNVQIFVLGCIDRYNEDFDLLDFRRRIDSGGITGNDGKLPSSVVTQAKDYRHIHADKVHFLSRLALGKVDPRVVVGSATVLHEDHVFRNGVVYFTYREPPGQGRGMRMFGHIGDCWYEAGEIIQGRTP